MIITLKVSSTKYDLLKICYSSWPLSGKKEKSTVLRLLTNNIACKQMHRFPRNKVTVFYYFRAKSELLVTMKIIR